MGLGLGQGLRVAVVVALLTGCCLEGAQGTSPPGPYPGSGNIGISLPYICPHEVTLSKLLINQTESGYVQYTEYVTDIPSLTSFTMHYWFNLADTTTTSTMFNYASDPSIKGEHLTVQLEAVERGKYQFWKVLMNGLVMSRVKASPPIRGGQWYHALHSWNSNTRTISHFINSNLLETQHNYKFGGLVIPGGGVAVSGQNQATELFSGMDQGEGLNGWFTLFHLSAKPIDSSSYSAGDITKVKLAFQCNVDIEGDLISWTTTPRKGYGGVTETPSYSKVCGRF